jgi:hypothetical protein
MPRIIALVLLVVAAIASPAAADPLYDFFHYEEPRPPVSGDCGAAGEGIWYGEFAGKRYDNFRDQYEPFSARGCFESELACRIWTNQAVTYLGRGPMIYATCRRRG